jgi:hypothetical protein
MVFGLTFEMLRRCYTRFKMKPGFQIAAGAYS